MYIMNKRGLRGFSSEQLVHETHSPAQGKEKKKLQGENWFFHKVLLFFFFYLLRAVTALQHCQSVYISLKDIQVVPPPRAI